MAENRDLGLGLAIAMNHLRVMREELDAETIAATFTTHHGEVEILVDKEGIEMQVDGKTVPMIGGNLR